MKDLDCTSLSPVAQLKAHRELLAELRSTLTQLSGIRFRLPRTSSLPMLRNRATQLRIFVKAELGEEAREMAVHEDTSELSLTLYRKDKRGKVFVKEGGQAAVAAASLPPPQLALQIMAGHYDRSSPLTARFAIPAGRTVYLALRNGGWFSPRFVAEADATLASALALAAQQAEGEGGEYIWDSVLAALRKGRLPPPAELRALATIRTPIPEAQRKELEGFGILPPKG